MVTEVSSSTQALQTLALYQQQQSEQTQGASAPPSPPSADDLFSKVSGDVDTDGNGITKDELEEYLEKLQESESEEDQGKAGLISAMIENFDKLSGGEDTITAESFKEGFDSIKPDGNGEPPGPPMQDPSEITSDQLQSPIDLRV